MGRKKKSSDDLSSGDFPLSNAKISNRIPDELPSVDVKAKPKRNLVNKLPIKDHDEIDSSDYFDPIPQPTEEKKRYKQYDPIPKYKWHDLRNIKQMFIKNNENRLILINMELNNGFWTSFLVAEKEGYFVFNKGVYILDLNLKYWHLDAKCYALDYHEGLSIPIKRKINVQGIKEAIESSQLYDCETATNPSLIRQFMVSNIVEQVIAGAYLSKRLQTLLLIAIITMVVVIIILILFMFKTGMFQQVAGIFGKHGG